MFTQTKRAFTLIEILLVVVILGILAAVLIPLLKDDLKAGSTVQVLSNIRQQLDKYHHDHGQYPDLAKEGWKPLIDGKYLELAPQNPLQNGSTSISSDPGLGVGWVWTSTGPSDPNSTIKAVYADGKIFDEDR